MWYSHSKLAQYVLGRMGYGVLGFSVFGEPQAALQMTGTSVSSSQRQRNIVAGQGGQPAQHDKARSCRQTL